MKIKLVLKFQNFRNTKNVYFAGCALLLIAVILGCFTLSSAIHNEFLLAMELCNEEHCMKWEFHKQTEYENER